MLLLAPPAPLRVELDCDVPSVPPVIVVLPVRVPDALRLVFVVPPPLLVPLPVPPPFVLPPLLPLLILPPPVPLPLVLPFMLPLPPLPALLLPLLMPPFALPLLMPAPPFVVSFIAPPLAPAPVLSAGGGVVTVADVSAVVVDVVLLSEQLANAKVARAAAKMVVFFMTVLLGFKLELSGPVINTKACCALW